MSTLTRAKPVAARTRNWCYTLNNYVEEDWVALHEVESIFHVAGQEVGESGTPHVQGFIVFKNARTMGAAKAALHPRVHLEAMRGSVEQATAYCLKEATVTFSVGVKPMSQKQKGEVGGAMEKGRWEVALEQARSTGDVEDAQIAFVHCRNVQFLHLQQEMKKPRVDTENKMLWYWGASGTGKSRKAREDNPDAYLKMCNKWWDGYAGEDVVLIEDFDKAHGVLCHHLKIWADRYPFLMEVKGAGCKIRPHLIIVTSNWHPSDIWTNDEDLGPVLRRFECVEFKGMKEHDD